jgi:SAM-dependent methyltransferase
VSETVAVALENLAVAPDPREADYEPLAPFYDVYTSGWDDGSWVGQVLELADDLGLAGRRQLDLACGTGKSFLPFVERGFRVTGCDGSRAMLAEAARKAPGIPLVHADLREVGSVGSFDLVTCFDDGLNYLPDEPDLLAALGALAANLSPNGIALFELNNLRAYRGIFAEDEVKSRGGAIFVWQGRSASDAKAGCTADADLDIFCPRGDGLYERIASRHRQRHYPRERVLALLPAAGLEPAGVYGVLDDNSLTLDLDELQQIRTLYAARLAKGVKPNDR